MTGAQIVLIWLTTAPIGAFGFRHSVLGAVEALYVAAAGGWGWSSAIGRFIVPAVLGNIVGGVIFVALVNHKQVAADKGGGELTSDRRRRTWRRFESNRSGAASAGFGSS